MDPVSIYFVQCLEHMRVWLAAQSIATSMSGVQELMDRGIPVARVALHTTLVAKGYIKSDPKQWYSGLF